MTTTVAFKEITCPICKQALVIEISADMLEPPSLSVTLSVGEGHIVNLDTTHYLESNRVVSQLMLAVITYCPGENK